MKISLNSVGKKFDRTWIFRNVNHVFQEGSATVILGSNGSGKSTLLQVISGYVIPAEGAIAYEQQHKAIAQEKVHTCFAFASPYIELMEEFTFRECVQFQENFRGWRGGLTEKSVIELSGLSHASDKQIRHYSSGMKQRAKLALCILSDAPALLLDEPCSNLDIQAQEWYATLIGDFRDNRTTIVCSNQVKEEYFFCDQWLEMSHFKS
jgi:ABC-type multidrug transport system ATPase subunit